MAYRLRPDWKTVIQRMYADPNYSDGVPLVTYDSAEDFQQWNRDLQAGRYPELTAFNQWLSQSGQQNFVPSTSMDPEARRRGGVDALAMGEKDPEDFTATLETDPSWLGKNFWWVGPTFPFAALGGINALAGSGAAASGGSGAAAAGAPPSFLPGELTAALPAGASGIPPSIGAVMGTSAATGAAGGSGWGGGSNGSGGGLLNGARNALGGDDGAFDLSDVFRILAGIGMNIPALMAANKGPSAEEKAYLAQVQSLLGQQQKRIELQSPLYEAATRLAFSRLPTSARRGEIGTLED